MVRAFAAVRASWRSIVANVVLRRARTVSFAIRIPRFLLYRRLGLSSSLRHSPRSNACRVVDVAVEVSRKALVLSWCVVDTRTCPSERSCCPSTRTGHGRIRTNLGRAWNIGVNHTRSGRPHDLNLGTHKERKRRDKAWHHMARSHPMHSVCREPILARELLAWFVFQSSLGYRANSILRKTSERVLRAIETK